MTRSYKPIEDRIADIVGTVLALGITAAALIGLWYWLEPESFWERLALAALGLPVVLSALKYLSR